jgi:hypothetical protein
LGQINTSINLSGRQNGSNLSRTAEKRKTKVDSLSYKTTYVNAATARKEWVLIDAQDEVLGRLASQAAKILRGKY